jgi:hypothetical protein
MALSWAFCLPPLLVCFSNLGFSKLQLFKSSQYNFVIYIYIYVSHLLHNLVTVNSSCSANTARLILTNSIS